MVKRRADLGTQAEDTLFKVNRRDFEEGSDAFRSMFDLPNGSGGRQLSRTEQPLFLEGVRADEMESFLAVVYHQ